jgi:hypothetical protein
MNDLFKQNTIKFVPYTGQAISLPVFFVTLYKIFAV